jgi:hypothetical protein
VAFPPCLCFRSDAKLTPSLLVQPTAASHALVPLPPPPPPLDGEDTKVSGPPLEHNRRTVPDADMDVYVDLGEAITRTPGLTPRPKSRSASPVLPDYLSPVHNATFAPVTGTQRPGECKAHTLLCVACTERQFQFVCLCAAAIAGAGAAVDHTPGPSSRVVTAVVKNQHRAKQPSSSRTTAEERKEKRLHNPRKPRRDEIDDIFA